MRARPLVLGIVVSAIASCGDKDPYIPLDDTGEADADADTDADTDVDEGTDADGDGFTVEDGDCDDNDIGVNPAREEDPFDQIDNDCDGRVDEQWSGLTATLQARDRRSSIQVFDTVSRVQSEITLPDGVVPYDVDHAIGGDGWVISSTDVWINITGEGIAFDYARASVSEVSTSGEVTTQAEFSDPNWEDGGNPELALFFWWGPIIRGVQTHPDGYYIAAMPNALYRVDPDGTVTELASWAGNLIDGETFELYAIDATINLLTGEVGLLGLLGGYATWSQEEGFVVHRSVDISEGFENWDAKLGVSLTRMDGDANYALMADYSTGEYEMLVWDEALGDWSSHLDWVNDLLTPLALTTDGDHGDWFATSKGGQYRTIWKIRGADQSVADFYNETEDGWSFWGLTSNY